jgi:hypothetical protein
MVVKKDLLGYMVDTYLSSIDISYDVLLETYLLDILVHVFDELMRWLYCTSLMSHIVDALIDGICFWVIVLG